jgi:hypothetical protein
MGRAGGAERFLKASLRQSGRAFGPAVYGTRERVPFLGGFYWQAERVPFPDIWRGSFLARANACPSRVFGVGVLSACPDAFSFPVSGVAVCWHA